MNTQGKKQVTEAVLIAVLCTAASGLVAWGLEEVKKRVPVSGVKKKKKKQATK